MFSDYPDYQLKTADLYDISIGITFLIKKDM